MEHLDFSSLSLDFSNPMIVSGNDVDTLNNTTTTLALMPSEVIHDLLLTQMHNEEYNARAYYQIYLLLKQGGYKCHELWYKYHLEEIQHAKKIEEFLIDFNVKNIELKPIMFTKNDIMCSTLHDAIMSTVMLENKNYDNIISIYKQIKDIDDDSCKNIAMRLLEEMIREQYEEKRKALLLQNYATRTNDILQLDEYLSSLV